MFSRVDAGEVIADVVDVRREYDRRRRTPKVIAFSYEVGTGSSPKTRRNRSTRAPVATPFTRIATKRKYGDNSSCSRKHHDHVSVLSFIAPCRRRLLAYR